MSKKSDVKKPAALGSTDKSIGAKLRRLSVREN